MGAVQVACATQDDLEAVVELFPGYLEFYGRSEKPENIASFLSARLDRRESVILLARLEDRLLGFAQCYPTWSSLSLAPAWVLNDLFVVPEGRGSGAGRALVRAAAHEARAVGAAYIALETAPDNATARRLYESEHFVLDDEFLHYSLGLSDG